MNMTAIQPSPLNILVADDQLSAVMVVSEVLKKYGHNVTTAVSGEDVLASIKSQTYDVIVLDLHMPPTKGDRFVSRVRAHMPHGSTCRLIVVSADTSEDQRDRVLMAGADDFIAKPVNWKLLMSRISLVSNSHV